MAAQMSSAGILLDCPSPGDIVTVRVKRQPKRDHSQSLYPSPIAMLVGEDRDEADNPQHYRMNAIWRVVASNAGQAVVEKLTGYDIGKREIWSVSHHEWFEASELYSALANREGSDV